MQLLDLKLLLESHVSRGQAYHEFLRSSDLSLGLYVLPAGAVDGQQPHTEEEAYFVLSGRGMLHCSGSDSPVHAGSLAFVPAGAVHYFHNIEEELRLLVIFGPAEHSRKSQAVQSPQLQTG